jgi:hypothetical protein
MGRQTCTGIADSVRLLDQRNDDFVGATGPRVSPSGDLVQLHRPPGMAPSLTAYDRWWVTDPLRSDAPWLSIVDADRPRAFSADGVAVALPGVDRQPKLAP